MVCLRWLERRWYNGRRGGYGLGLSYVQQRGQVTIPTSVRKAAGIKAGDGVLAYATGPGKVEIRVVKRLTLEELWARYEADAMIDEEAVQQAMAEAIAEHVLRTDRP